MSRYRSYIVLVGPLLPNNNISYNHITNANISNTTVNISDTNITSRPSPAEY